MRRLIRHITHPKQWWRWITINVYWDGYNDGQVDGYLAGLGVGKQIGYQRGMDDSLPMHDGLYGHAPEGSDDDLIKILPNKEWDFKHRDIGGM